MRSSGRIEAILETLRDFGPMTRVDLELTLGYTKQQVSRLTLCIITESPRLPQRAHILTYVEDQEGQKRYPRPVYAYGPGRNAEKPKSDPKAVQKRSRDRKRRLTATNSVFNLARGIPYAARALNQIRREHEAH